MNDSLKIFNFGSLLIESSRNESEQDFRTNVVEILTEIYGHVPEWLEFKVGRRFERQSTFYREFLCAAGSVDGRIQLRAKERGGLHRVVVLRGMRSGTPCCSEIRSGIETEFNCDELREIPD